MIPFRERLTQGGIVGDGAMGTMLQQAGLPLGASPEAWNLSHPAAVVAVHRAYREAGAEIAQTNSFGGTRARLAICGLEEQVAAVNRAAVALAREAVGETAYVAGTVGPTGVSRGPGHEEPPWHELFTEQIDALAEAGVDLFLIETIVDPREASAAIAAARRARSVPVLATVTVDAAGKTLWGATDVDAARALVDAGADAVGANCGEGPAALYPVIAAMRAAFPELPLVVQPNAGLPTMASGRACYPIDAATFGHWAARFAPLAQIVGGCCGTTPEHIKVVATAVHGDGRPISQARTPVNVRNP
jgi:5-methyltetrahydrofolate--homocysteine methyltransferase